MKFLRLLLISALILSGVAYLTLPNYLRGFTPTLFGTTEISHRVYTDAPEKSEELLQIQSNGSELASMFYGTLQSDPRIIFCTTVQCQDRFGFRSNGLAVGKSVILIGPEGLNPTIVAHEMSHMEIRHYLGISDFFSPRIPAWFDEGLASYVAQDTRLTSYDAAEATWIFQAQNFRDWSRMTNAENWPETYGAAQSLIKDLSSRLGADGLHRVIQSALARTPIEDAIQSELGSAWP